MRNIFTTTLQQQLSKLEKLLNVDSPNINLIDKVALGLLSADVQTIWWRSNEPFKDSPSPLLQDDLSLYAQHTWQRWRREPALLQHLSDSIKTYQNVELLYQCDLNLHLKYPELSLIKYWLASVSCCCRDVFTDQEELWYKHLRLTQSLLLAQRQQAFNPDCIVGYAEHNIVIVNLEKRESVIVCHEYFQTFQCSEMTFIYYPYPT